MKRTAFLTLALALLLCAGARAAMSDLTGTFDYLYHSLTVRTTMNRGGRAVLDRPAAGWTQAGAELPVVRDERIVGLLRVDYSGSLHIYGSFVSHNPDERIQRGDVVVIPVRVPERAPAHEPLGMTPARVIYHFPAGHSYWALISRGAVDGIQGGDGATVTMNRETTGEFKVVYAGREWSYGLFSPYVRDKEPAFEALEIHFDKQK